MGFLSKVFREIEKTVTNQLEDHISKTTGINVRAEVYQYDREIKLLERELETLEEQKEDYIEEYGQVEYIAMVRDIKSEISVCKQIKIDIMKDIIESSREECKENYRQKISTISDKQLRKIYDNPDAPKLLKEVIEEELNYR